MMLFANAATTIWTKQSPNKNKHFNQKGVGGIKSGFCFRCKKIRSPANV